MKRIFLSALIGVGMVAAIFQILLGSEAARMQQSYPLVCRGSANLEIGIAPNEGNIAFTFTRGTKPASQGLAPGECSWVDRGMYPNEPDRLSQHVANGLESLKSEGNTAPENRWYEELHSSDKYWTFMVYNDRQGRLIVTGARANEEMREAPKPRVPLEINKRDDPPEKKKPAEEAIPPDPGSEGPVTSTPRRGSGGRVEVAPATFQDISPDSEFGDLPTYAEASGPVSNIVADPKYPNVLYAASWYGGIWKSTDAARSWKPANRGLATPFAQIVNRALAIDDQNSQRLLFAAFPDDFRPFQPLGGLWFSQNAAADWIHIDLPSCSVPAVYTVGFVGGVAFARTGCGIFLARDDPANGDSWTKIPDPPGVNNFNLIGANSRLYTCGEKTTTKSTDKPTTMISYREIGPTGAWTFATSLPLYNCYDLAVAPDDPDDLIVAIGDPPPTASSPVPPLQVWRAKIGSSLSARLGEGFTFPPGGSGSISLHTVRRPRALSAGPGLSYDLFVADAWNFRQYEADGGSGSWTNFLSPGLLSPDGKRDEHGLHVDTHTMAFPPTYDPEKGNCTAWAATDGGVYATTAMTAGTRCDTWNSKWRHASHGLHIMASESMAGVRNCGEGGNACPAIYLPTGHDDLWASLNGGRDWTRMGGLGDVATAMLDPAIPGQVLGARGGGGDASAPDRVWRKFKGKDTDASPSLTTDFANNLNSSGRRLFGYPPHLTLAQIMTLPSGDTAAPNGDYVSLERPSSEGSPRLGTLGDILPSIPTILSLLKLDRFDVIVRSQTGLESDWKPIAVFARDAVAALSVSGGHKNPVFYVLTNSGELFALCSSPTPAPLCSSGTPTRPFGISPTNESVWATVPGGTIGGPVSNLIVNPYDPKNLYVTSRDSKTIRSSTDGGITWVDEPDLNEVASNQGEFRLGRMAEYLPMAEYCSLEQMIFVRDHPNYRFALLIPGGVAFSRDSGKHWIAIQGPWSYGRAFSSDKSLLSAVDRVYPFVLPINGFYDDTVDPIRHTSSLYVSLKGRGIVRVDAAFAKLGVGP